MDEVDEIEINTTTRYQHYCREKAQDGRVCSLYAPHEGKCKPKNGVESDRFSPGE